MAREAVEMTFLPSDTSPLMWHMIRPNNIQLAKLNHEVLRPQTLEASRAPAEPVLTALGCHDSLPTRSCAILVQRRGENGFKVHSTRVCWITKAVEAEVVAIRRESRWRGVCVRAVSEVAVNAASIENHQAVAIRNVKDVAVGWFSREARRAIAAESQQRVELAGPPCNARPPHQTDVVRPNQGQATPRDFVVLRSGTTKPGTGFVVT
jgi:hypothetical protein